MRKCPPNLLAPLVKIVIEEIRKACKKHPLSCGFNPSDNAYEPLKLMQTVMAKTNEVCLRYLDNSLLCSLPSPGAPYFITSACAAKNTRRKMEDRHVIIHDLNTMFNIQEASPSSYYAVFDGHAGHHAAAYSSAHLHQFLAENKHFISNPEQALLDAFCKTDALFTDKCKVECLSSGTTAVVALLRPKERTLYIAWAGDSQALLVNQGRILQVVNPHKPSREDERERIEKRGGCVMLWGTWRVNGQLAVSRAIGDAEYKPFVIAVPDVREIHLDGGEDFLILACDGLWDFVSEDYVARTVYDLIIENPDDTDRIGKRLVQLSKDEGSNDNISVIVVFLRQPSKIAAEAHWANRNTCTSATMDASLDNANNPFAISNGGATDNIISQKNDGLHLNLTDNYKQNGTDLSPTPDFYAKEKSNGKRSASEIYDEDFGPETDIDTVDDLLSPVEKAKGFGDVFSNNNPAEDVGQYNPFMEHQEKAALEIERALKRQDSEKEFDEQRFTRDETPTPPADAVHDVSGLVDNAAESDSEDEWNYFKGDDADKENISPQPNKEVASVPEEDDNMSQLNPDAAEFVPISPTRSIPSPACRTLMNDQVISQSPRRATANDIDINVPNPSEFAKEVKSRPSEVDSYNNGHSDCDLNTTPTDLMESLLNGKHIDEIPEFQPGSTPNKTAPSEEFHFGPNAAPFTPLKFLDQSETGLSTKAVFGDESTATLGTSFNESVISQDTASDVNLLGKESDPMSMSFYADKGDTNPFDLNEVQVLPENLDEFLSKPDNITFNDTISDLPEHYPLGEPEKNADITLNNDYAIQKKQGYDDEKELASPLEPEKELSEADRYILTGDPECGLAKTPEPTNENLLQQDFCHIPGNVKSPEPLPRDVELISPEHKQPESASSRPESSISGPESFNEDIVEARSPLPETSEVSDLPKELEAQAETYNFSVPEANETADLLSPEEIIESKSSEIEAQRIADEAAGIGVLLSPEEIIPSKSFEIEADTSKSPLLDLKVNDLLEEPKSPLPELEDESPLLEACQLLPQSKSPTGEILEAKSPVSERSDLVSPVCDFPGSKSPVCEFQAKSPVCDISDKSPSPQPFEVDSCGFRHESVIKSSPTETVLEDTPLEFPSLSLPSAPTQPVDSTDYVKPEEIANADEHFELICTSEKDFGKVESDFTSPAVLEQAQEYFDDMFKPKVSTLESPQEDSTCSLKDDLPSPKSPVSNLVVEDSIAADQSAVVSDLDQNLIGAVKESISESVASPEPQDSVIMESCLNSTPISIPDTESVMATDVNSFLDRSLPPDVTSPLSSTTEQEVDDTKKCMYPADNEQLAVEQAKEQHTIPDVLDLNHPLSKCVYPLPTGEEIDIKTEKITPEFAVQAIITPSEESNQEDVPSAPPLVEPVKELMVDEQNLAEQIECAQVVADVAAAATVSAVTEPETKTEEKIEIVPLAAAAAVATTAAAVTKVVQDEKKKPASPTKKATAPKSTTTHKMTTKLAPKPPSQLSVSPKAISARTTTAKAATSAPKPAATKTLPKPRPMTTLKPTERKPLTNGDVKSTSPRTTLLAKKAVSETITTRTAAPRPATAATKASPTKAPAPARPATAPRAAATRTTTSVTAPKPRSTTLTNRSTASSAAKATTAATKTAPTSAATKTSPKTATAPRPKPPVSTTLIKPRVPLTKTVTRTTPDTEKQNKESANKLTASRTLTSRTTSATSRSTASTVRKIESRVTASRTTTSKTTTTTMKSTTAKKPTEIVRHTTIKAKTTKIEKPKENGISTVVTEEITMNGTPNSIMESEPQLIKDNSPVDNKLTIENTLIQTNTAD